MGTAARDEAREVFAEAGIEFPPVPERFVKDFRRVRNWCYASRDIDAFEMYIGQRYPLEVAAGPVDDYVGVSQAGHGINSYSLNYDLVYGWVAVFVQVAWGGVYGDEAAQVATIAEAFGRCRDIAELVEQLPARPPTGRGRLVVVQSDLYDSNVCRWLPEPIAADEVPQWLERGEIVGEPAVNTAIAWLKARRLDGVELV